MKILMHLCCGPCTEYPLSVLQAEGIGVKGYFYNPNIHPFQEFKKRMAALESLSNHMELHVDYEREYGLRQYLRKVVFHEKERCSICYEMRLSVAAKKAQEIGADAFTTTLLYSKYQKHDLIRQIGERIARAYTIPFYYKDFRLGWQQGIEMSKEMGLYRQPYCGCIYSEQERYDRNRRKKSKTTT